MKKITLIVLLVSTVGSMSAQLPLTMNAAEEICDSLEANDFRKYSQFEKVYKNYLSMYHKSAPLILEVSEYKDSSKQSLVIYDNYFKFQLQRNCEQYRQINNEIDNYLVDKPTKRGLYLQAKQLFFRLETTEYTELLSLMNSGVTTDEEYKEIQKLLRQVSDKCYLNIIWIGVDGGIFRFRLYNIYSDEMMLLLDLNYSDSDNLLDGLSYKLEEQKPSVGPNDQIPPPPPPPSPKKD